MNLMLDPEDPTKVLLPSGGVLTNVHHRMHCAGRVCIVHRPSNHHMSDWKLHWRDDRGIFERICDHGVGHPDPDQFEYWDEAGELSQAIHGCDLCCLRG